MLGLASSGEGRKKFRSGELESIKNGCKNQSSLDGKAGFTFLGRWPERKSSAAAAGEVGGSSPSTRGWQWQLLSLHAEAGTTAAGEVGGGLSGVLAEAGSISPSPG